MKDYQRIRLRVTNELTGFAKNLRLALPDLHRLTVWDAIYGNPSLGLIRPPESKEEYEIQCSLMGEVLSTNDMKSTMINELLEERGDMNEEAMIQIVVYCHKNKATIVQDTDDTVEVLLSEIGQQFEEVRAPVEDSEDELDGMHVEEIVTSEDAADKVINSSSFQHADGEVDLPQTIQVNIQNRFTKRSKELVVYVSDDVNVHRHIYDNPAVHNAYVRTWSEDIVEAIKNETSVICCSIRGTPVILSLTQMKETTSKQLVEYIPKDAIRDPVHLVLTVIKATSLANEVSDVMTTTEEEIEALASQRAHANILETRAAGAPSMENGVISGKTETMRVNIANQFTRRFKELDVEVSDNVSICQSIYDHPMVLDAHVRTWSPDVVAGIKTGSKEITCSIVGTHVRLSVEQMKETSTKELKAHSSEDVQKVPTYLVLGITYVKAPEGVCAAVESEIATVASVEDIQKQQTEEQEENARADLDLSTDTSLASNRSSFSLPSETEQSQEEAKATGADKVLQPKAKELCPIAIDETASDTCSEEPKGTGATRTKLSEGFRQRGWLPGVASKHMRVNVRNQFSRRSKEILIVVSDELSVYQEIYCSSLVEDVRKWAPSIMAEIANGRSEITCGVVGTSIVLSPSEMEETSTKQLLEYASERNTKDHILVQLVLRVTKREADQTNKVVQTPEETLKSNMGASVKAPAMGSGGGDLHGDENLELSKDDAEGLIVSQCKEVVEKLGAKQNSTKQEISFKPTGFRQRGWLPEEDGSTATYIPVRITNQVTNRSKDLLVLVSKESTIFQAIYDNPVVRDANVRKWPKIVAHGIKSETSMVQCKLLRNDGAFARSYSVDDMKQTSTLDLRVRVTHSDNPIRLVLMCTERENKQQGPHLYSSLPLDASPSFDEVETPVLRNAVVSGVVAVNDGDGNDKVVVTDQIFKTRLLDPFGDAVQEKSDSTSIFIESQPYVQYVPEKKTRKEEVVPTEVETVVVERRLLEDALEQDASIAMANVQRVEGTEEVQDEIPQTLSDTEPGIVESSLRVGKDSSSFAVDDVDQDNITGDPVPNPCNIEVQIPSDNASDELVDEARVSKELNSKERTKEHEAVMKTFVSNRTNSHLDGVRSAESSQVEAKDDGARFISRNTGSQQLQKTDEIEEIFMLAVEPRPEDDETVVNNVLGVEHQVEKAGSVNHGKGGMSSVGKKVQTKESENSDRLVPSTDCESTIATFDYEKVQVSKIGCGMVLKALEATTTQQRTKNATHTTRTSHSNEEQTSTREQESKHDILALTAKYEILSNRLKSLIIVAMEYNTAMKERGQARTKVSPVAFPIARVRIVSYRCHPSRLPSSFSKNVNRYRQKRRYMAASAAL